MHAARSEGVRFMDNLIPYSTNVEAMFKAQVPLTFLKYDKIQLRGISAKSLRQ